MTMRIAYIASRYPEVSHTFIQREVLALRARGIDVHTFAVRKAGAASVLSAADRDEAARTTSLLPTTALRLLTAHAASFFASPGRYLRALWTALTDRPAGLRSLVWHLFYFAEAGLLAAELRRREVRHVHAHFANVAASVARLAAEMTGGTWSITLHGLADFGNPASNHLAAKIASARLVICISRFGVAQAMLNSAPADWPKIVRVPCGVDLQRFKPRSASPGDFSDRPMRLLTVGRLGPEKGHLVLLEALAKLRAGGGQAELTLVGEGPQRIAIEEATGRLGLRGAVTLAGAVGQDDIQEYYEAADVFVLPSLAEGLPVVLMEALAGGVPVVASGIMGIPELVRNGETGLLVPPADAEALASALARLARDGDLRQRLAAAGRELVRESHDLEKSAARVAELFTELLSPATVPEPAEARSARRVGAVVAPEAIRS
jgi:glycosyltransferase involved in cell wall biosynthesis